MESSSTTLLATLITESVGAFCFTSAFARQTRAAVEPG